MNSIQTVSDLYESSKLSMLRFYLVTTAWNDKISERQHEKREVHFTSNDYDNFLLDVKSVSVSPNMAYNSELNITQCKETLRSVPRNNSRKRKKAPRNKNKIESRKWNLDRYKERSQTPKSTDDLVAEYGYDIRSSSVPPKTEPQNVKRCKDEKDLFSTLTSEQMVLFHHIA